MHFEKILSRSHGNFEDKNKVFEPVIIIINYLLLLMYITIILNN